MVQPVVVSVTHRYTAPAERVFDAWLTPSLASRFFFATRTGNIMQCELEPRVGGSFFVTDRRPNADGDESVFDTVHRGWYVEIDRPRRLVFDFHVMSVSEDTTRVEIDIQPTSVQSCELTLTHHMGSSEEARSTAGKSRQGWERMLQALETQVFPRRVGIF